MQQIEQIMQTLASQTDTLNANWPKYHFFVDIRPDENKPVCCADWGALGIYAKLKVKDRSKYSPHQGKQEAERRHRRARKEARAAAWNW